MARGIGQVHVRKQRGVLVVQGMGQTPREQSYISKTEILTVQNTADPNFKRALLSAVEAIIEEEGTPT